jgi:hypothetical protein
MSRFRFHLSVSVDGYVAGPNQRAGSTVAEGIQANVGAEVMGRNKFGGGPGP